MKKIILLLITVLLISGCSKKVDIEVKRPEPTVTPTIIPSITSTPTIIPSITSTPTPKLVTIEDLNKKFGPCARVSVLMYHHIQDEVTAKVNNQVSLTVTPDFFRKHMQYLKDKGYSVIGMADLNNFFNSGTTLPKKAAMITLDDAYEDNYTNAYPILKEFGFKATIFVPTGHVMGFEYLRWNQIEQMKDLVNFSNHTWSHHSSTGSLQVLEKEISLADKQLAEHGLNNDKVFAYPYGNSSSDAEKILAKYGYTLAFTTKHGSIMCKGQKYILPRIRAGNKPLSSFGL